MLENARVLLFMADKVLTKALTDDLRQAGYLVDRCENLETCQHVNSFYDHDAAFLQADDDDLEMIQTAASYVTPGARIIVLLRKPDPQITERFEMHGIQVVAHPSDSAALVDLLRDDSGD